MKWLLACFAFLVVALATNISAAETPKSDVAVVAPMKKGNVAPFEGVLFNTRATAQLLAEMEAQKAAAALEVNKAKAVARAQCDKELADGATRAKADKQTAEAQRKMIEARLATTQKALAAAEKRAKRPNMYLVGSLGFAGGVVVTVGTILLVGQATK